MAPISPVVPHGSRLALTVESGDALDVRQFTVHERMSSLFDITLLAMSDNPAIDFDAVVGRPARFILREAHHERSWSGVCSQIQQVRVEEDGLSTYQLTLVPELWFATQRRNYRVFQQMSEPDIVLKLLEEWGIRPDVKLTAEYKKRKYRVQYAESDYAFMSRMLEEAGISFYFAQVDGETRLVLSDAPHLAALREPLIPFKDDISMVTGEYVTKVNIAQKVRPGRYTMRDHDYRRAPSNQPMSSAEAANVDIEKRLERYHYTPGAFLFGTDQGEATPAADDKGKVRVDEAGAQRLAQRRLEAKRSSAKVCTFETNAADLSPGVVISLLDHPRPDLGPKQKLLVVEVTHEGTWSGEWSHRCEARSASVPYRPPLSTPRPKAIGAESATVVGPPGEEIHTDEFGRVRVHFHWNRESKMDDNSSCWIHVSQPWGGTGYGGINLPRVGQEVLVEFLGGDPDRPVIIGRVYTNLQKVPYKLPANKTQSGWKSNSTNGTGGYNEIMFEDAAGNELFRMQAEKDLQKLVKNDERVTIGHDRTKLVQHDDDLTVGHDRTKLVENDERVTIGHDRTKLVKHDDGLTVGHDRTKLVENDERVTIGRDRTKLVKRDDDFTVGHDRTKLVENDERVTIGRNRTKVVKNDDDFTVGNNRTKLVKNDESVTIGRDRVKVVKRDDDFTVGNNRTKLVKANERSVVGQNCNVVVGVNRSTLVGSVDATSVGSTHVVSVSPPGDGGGSATIVQMQHDLIELSTPGGSKITLRGGDVTIEAKNITLEAENITLLAKSFLGGASSQETFIGGATGLTLSSKGGDVVVRGGPMVKINP